MCPASKFCRWNSSSERIACRRAWSDTERSGQPQVWNLVARLEDRRQNTKFASQFQQIVAKSVCLLNRGFSPWRGRPLSSGTGSRLSLYHNPSTDRLLNSIFYRWTGCRKSPVGFSRKLAHPFERLDWSSRLRVHLEWGMAQNPLQNSRHVRALYWRSVRYLTSKSSYVANHESFLFVTWVHQWTMEDSLQLKAEVPW